MSDLAVKSSDLSAPLARREKIFALQAALEKEPPYNPEPQHTFAPGAYARTLLLDKDSLVVGKIHKHAHINVISFGHVLVMTEGEGLLELHGPLVFTSTPGTKRAVYALEDTLWTTVHVTNETDLEKVENDVIAKTYQEYDSFRLTDKRQLGIEFQEEVK
jgi:hypothetical protein